MPDDARVLVQKDVGAERWAISYNLSDRTVTGNVFKTDGSPPSFIFCRITNETPAPDPAANTYLLDCSGAQACAAAPCGPEQWTPIASNWGYIDTTLDAPGAVTDVLFDPSTNFVHVLGQTPDGSAPTIYVIEPHANAFFADAPV